jgi:transglutaminase-like putative cysteine protease
MGSRASKVATVVLGTIVRTIWVSLMILTPLLGFWLASSLAAYHNATQWLALLVGLLLFPIVPVAWDLLFVWRRSRRAHSERAVLTGLDRLVLRTLIVNLLFLGGMMWKARADSFRALAVRGDWMLDGRHGPIAQTIREHLLGAADYFDRRQQAQAHYGESDKPPEVTPEPEAPRPLPTDVDPPAPAPDAPSAHPTTWPMRDTLHPLVTAMAEGEQTSVEAVGAYFAARITDKRELAKALHDYVVHRLHYDYDALRLIEARDFASTPPQTADEVFARRAGVCEGYARLLVALGNAAGIEIAYITGHIRDSERRLTVSDDPWDGSAAAALEGVGHAWNAVKLDDRWFLIDATWNDPTNRSEPSKQSYRTTYLFTPPQLFALDHFPKDPRWQLLPSPLSLGDFVRQPLLSPSIGRFGLTLVSPKRSQVTVDGSVTIVLDNPLDAAIAAHARREGSGRGSETRCDVTAGKQTKIVCPLRSGEYEVQMFAAPEARARAARYSLDYFGSILVNSR